MGEGVNTVPTLHLERELYLQGFTRVAGIDEVGRGPLAGPVVASAVVLSPSLHGTSAEWLQLVDDSKVLTARRREAAYEDIQRHALAVGTGVVSHDEIDRVGIVRATCRAMLVAVEQLAVQPDYLILDYIRFPDCPFPFRALVDGDSLCYSIAAASIVAKVTRDRLMQEADRLYPGYGFAKHKGYATQEHLEALARLGPTPIHRTYFAPVAALMMNLFPDGETQS
jgi:ribonuclease HII